LRFHEVRSILFDIARIPLRPKWHIADIEGSRLKKSNASIMNRSSLEFSARNRTAVERAEAIHLPGHPSAYQGVSAPLALWCDAKQRQVLGFRVNRTPR
jgi:hypothetical protein